MSTRDELGQIVSQACEKDNSDKLERLFRMGSVNVNDMDADGYSYLILAYVVACFAPTGSLARRMRRLTRVSVRCIVTAWHLCPTPLAMRSDIPLYPLYSAAPSLLPQILLRVVPLRAHIARAQIQPRLHRRGR